MFGFWLIVRISASYPDFNVRILASCPIRSSTYLLLLVRLCYARTLVVIPSLSLLLRGVVLGVASTGNCDVHLGVDLPNFELLFCYKLSDFMKP